MDNLEKLLDAIGRISTVAVLFESYEAEYIGDDFSLTVRTNKDVYDEE